MFSFIKRLIEVCLSLLALPFLALLLIFVWLTRTNSNDGSLIFSQPRIGKNHQPFKIYKIRTMVPNATELGPIWTLDDDPRITRIGKWLRRTSLDELPQLVNVIKGDMSFIGPRPVQVAIDDMMSGLPGWTNRYKVRPGMTGLAQVELAGTSALDYSTQSLSYDLHYVEHESCRICLSIFAKTTIAIWRRYTSTPSPNLRNQAPA